MHGEQAGEGSTGCPDGFGQEAEAKRVEPATACRLGGQPSEQTSSREASDDPFGDASGLVPGFGVSGAELRERRLEAMPLCFSRRIEIAESQVILLRTGSRRTLANIPFPKRDRQV